MGEKGGPCRATAWWGLCWYCASAGIAMNRHNPKKNAQEWGEGKSQHVEW